MTKKQQTINKLMENTNYAYPHIIRMKLESRTLKVMEFYMHTMRGCTNQQIIHSILTIG